MIEEHAEIGRPFQCAGLVNPPAMQMVGLEDTILQNVDGALIHSPSGIMVPAGKDGRVRTHVAGKFDQAVEGKWRLAHICGYYPNQLMPKLKVEK